MALSRMVVIIVIIFTENVKGLEFLVKMLKCLLFLGLVFVISFASFVRKVVVIKMEGGKCQLFFIYFFGFASIMIMSSFTKFEYLSFPTKQLLGKFIVFIYQLRNNLI